jgi:hypothetical protein
VWDNIEETLHIISLMITIDLNCITLESKSTVVRRMLSACYSSYGMYTLRKKHNLIIPLMNYSLLKLKLKSVAVVRKRTIPTERPPLVSEVSDNLVIIIWFVRILAARPLLAYCASLG